MFLKCILVQKFAFFKYKSGILHGYKIKTLNLSLTLMLVTERNYNIHAHSIMKGSTRHLPSSSLLALLNRYVIFLLVALVA
jgi:hypothetical protein